MTLLELLQTYSGSHALPMHMPGHKRNTRLAPYLSALGAGLDITEIPGFSNLHDPEGELAQRMTDAAGLWGSRRAWWLIGGSTAGLLAAIDASTHPGDRVLIARNCHKSVYNACMLCNLNPAYIQPSPFPGHSFADRITPEQVEQAFLQHPDTRLVVLTSPTYEGLCSDISAISDIVHRHNAVLLVDEAHGAHLGLSHHFPPSAVTQGADLVVQSLHKTLPSLTQTAMLHLCSDRVDGNELGFRLSVYQTSSPSYLLMASIDSCVALLKDRGEALFAHWADSIAQFHSALSLRHLTMPLGSVGYADPSKLLISTAGTNITGPALGEILRTQYAIEPEMTTADTVLCMTGMGDTWDTLLRLATALNDIDRTLSQTAPTPPLSLPIPHRHCTPSEAAKQPTELLPLEQAEGRIAAQFLWAYPPGIPLVVPGEVVSPDLVQWLRTAEAKGVDISGSVSTPTGAIRVLKQQNDGFPVI